MGTRDYFKTTFKLLTTTAGVVEITLRPLTQRKVLRSTNELPHTVSEPLSSTLDYFLASYLNILSHSDQSNTETCQNIRIIRPPNLYILLIEVIPPIQLNYAKDSSASYRNRYNWLTPYY